MTSTRPRLVVIGQPAGLASEEVEALRQIFDLISVDSADDARQMMLEGEAYVLAPAGELNDRPLRLPDPTRVMLESLGEGMGIVDESGRVMWSSRRLDEQDEATRGEFRRLCVASFEAFAATAGEQADRFAARRVAFSTEQHHYELVISPAGVDADDPSHVTAVAGVLWEVTHSRQLQKQIDAIDAAGAELLRIEPAAVVGMNMHERLKLLEQKIIKSVKELLNFDNFEIRLLDRESNRLELVIAVGIKPLKIGEVIYAEKTGNGISGYVAATGESYICSSCRADPLYHEGLDNAASSLTVPLRLHDKIIGVFNVESYTLNAFDDNDRLFAEIFGRYVAMAMNILDLLVVERYTTNEQVAGNVLREVDEPLHALDAQVEALRGRVGDDETARTALQDIQDGLAALRERIERSASGPRSILGAEQELRREPQDPDLVGRRVLLADNEPVILDRINELLTQKGCRVTACSSGVETIEQLEHSAERGQPFDLVISDIKMPDRNGYEVFQKAKSVDPDTPTILMTGFGYDPHHSIIRASQEGLHSLLFKPFQASQLIDAVKKALAERDAARASQAAADEAEEEGGGAASP